MPPQASLIIGDVLDARDADARSDICISDPCRCESVRELATKRVVVGRFSWDCALRVFASVTGPVSFPYLRFLLYIRVGHKHMSAVKAVLWDTAARDRVAVVQNEQRIRRHDGVVLLPTHAT